MSENKTKFSTSLAKINDAYFPMIERQLTGNGIQMDDYSKQCVLNAISSINNALDQKGITWNDPQLDQSNITEILLNVASLKLNSSASPNEVYFQVRNVKFQKRNENGKLVDDWRKQIEMGIEGDGNDAILSRFGRDVETVHQFWVVREDDDFQYPSYEGIEVTPPKWTPKGTGKAVRVVYPIEKRNGRIEYHISEREDVIKNLIAHVKNNMMNETFGLAESKYKATPKQKQQIEDKKNEVIDSIKAKGLDGALNDKELQKYISPAWKDEQSKESMILRKMRNNVVKRIPKDFGIALRELSYENSTNDYENRIRKDVSEQANGEVLDIIDHEETVEEEEPEPEKPKTEETERQEKEKPKVVTKEEQQESNPSESKPPF
jgi:hypothetical protein